MLQLLNSPTQFVYPPARHSATTIIHLQRWQDYYNRQRNHGSINQTPWQKWQQLGEKTLTFEQVRASYELTKERIRHRDYRMETGKPR